MAGALFSSLSEIAFEPIYKLCPSSQPWQVLCSAHSVRSAQLQFLFSNIEKIKVEGWGGIKLFLPCACCLAYGFH